MDGGIGNVGVYSRVPYDSWPFNAMSGAHTGIKPDVSGYDYVSEFRLGSIPGESRNLWNLLLTLDIFV